MSNKNEPIMPRLVEAAREMLEVLMEVELDLLAYCEDHNSDNPTDVTIVLPKISAVIKKILRNPEEKVLWDLIAED